MSKYYLLSRLILPMRESGTLHGFGNNESIEKKQKAYEEFAGFDNNSIVGNSPPQNYTFLKLSKTDEIKVVYFDYDCGNFLIKTNSRRSAYSIANIIYGYHCLYRSWVPDPDTPIYFLQEIKRIPKYNWTITDVIAALDEKIHSWYGVPESCAMKAGFEVSNFTHEDLKIFLTFYYRNFDAREVLDYLLKSIQICGGVPNESYYHFNYILDRKEESRTVLNKRYFEHRITYETSFITAFKGVERFFKVAQIRKKEINNIFRNISYEDISPDTIYTRYFEIFSGHKKQIKYRKLIEHFLELRNSVAAHGNLKDPKRKIIIEDNIIEIQFFLQELLEKVLKPHRVKVELLKILNNLIINKMNN